MNKSDLISKIQLALDDNSIEAPCSWNSYANEFIDALVLFKLNTSQENISKRSSYDQFKL